jgi:CHRD domain
VVSRIRAALITLVPAALISAGTIANPANPDARTYTVPLVGQAEVNSIHPGGGDMDGSGLVRLTIDPARKQICYDFTLSGLSTPLMAHIHRAPALRNGPTVVTLFTGPGVLDDCVMWTEERLAEIVAHASNFYVNVYTTEYPDGALRGQLT